MNAEVLKRSAAIVRIIAVVAFVAMSFGNCFVKMVTEHSFVQGAFDEPVAKGYANNAFVWMALLGLFQIVMLFFKRGGWFAVIGSLVALGLTKLQPILLLDSLIPGGLFYTEWLLTPWGEAVTAVAWGVVALHIAGEILLTILRYAENKKSKSQFI